MSGSGSGSYWKAAAAAASFLRFEGVLDAGFLLRLVYERPKWDSEEAARTVIESLRMAFGRAKRVGHKKGRLRSWKLEEEGFEARTNMLQGVRCSTCRDEMARVSGVIGAKHREGMMKWQKVGESEKRKISLVSRLACLISSKGFF